MIQIVPQMRILVAVEPVDFRNGIDGLVRLCKQKLGSDPFVAGCSSSPIDGGRP
jgi:transposase